MVTGAEQWHPHGVVTVIGDAVIDHIYRTDTMPSEGSEASGTFEAQVGGKGLNWAVAAARLGLRVRLVTVIGDDDSGRRIIEYLRRENVDTGLVKVVPGTTPVAVVMVDRNGAGAFIGRVDGAKLGIADLRGEQVRAAIVSSDAVLLTFELPTEVINEALSMIRATPQRPRLVVHPAPPVENFQDLERHLEPIDYLNGSSWELGELAGDSDNVGGEHFGDDHRARAAGTRCILRLRGGGPRLPGPLGHPSTRHSGASGGGIGNIPRGQRGIRRGAGLPTRADRAAREPCGFRVGDRRDGGNPDDQPARRRYADHARDRSDRRTDSLTQRPATTAPAASPPGGRCLAASHAIGKPTVSGRRAATCGSAPRIRSPPGRPEFHWDAGVVEPASASTAGPPPAPR